MTGIQSAPETLQLFPGRTDFQVRINSYREGEIFYQGSFDDVATAALHFVITDLQKPKNLAHRALAAVGLADTIKLSEFNWRKSKYESVPPVPSDERARAITAMAQNYPAQLWLMIQTDLFPPGYDPSIDLPGMKHQIEKGDFNE